MNVDNFFQQPNYRTLFQTQAWQDAWQSTWGAELDANKQLSRDAAGHYYRWCDHLKGVLPVNTIVPHGCSSSALRSVRSEYWRPAENVGQQLNDLLSSNTHQVLLPDVVLNAPVYHEVLERVRPFKQHVIVRNRSIAYSVNTAQSSFADYLKTLGSNTRLKFYNRRKRLGEKGIITLTNLWPDVDKFLSLINEFHSKRWGKPCFKGLNQEFIKALLPALEAEGHQIVLSALMVDDRPVSLLLDIQVDARIYNLQSGYLEDFQKGVSLGTLHFGYRIEEAFNDSTVDAYDFMAGEGKNTNYKEKLANQNCELGDLLVVKPYWLLWLYRLNEFKNRE